MMRANLWKLQAYWFCHSLIFAYVIERLFGLERGLDIQQMVWLEMAYAAISLTLEVPSGALADRWSRKNTLVLSAIFTFFEFFILIFADNFWGFLLSAFAAACGGALASGTDNALLYDSLKALGREPDFEKLLGRIRLWGGLAGLFASVAGSQIAVRMGLTATYWFSLIGVSGCILFSLSLREPPIASVSAESGAADAPRADEEGKGPDDSEIVRIPAVDEAGASVTGPGYWRHMLAAMRFLFSHRALASMAFTATTLAACFVYLDEYAQIYLKDVGVPIGLFGIWAGAYMLLETLCVASAWRLRGWLGPQWLLALLMLTSGAGLLLAGQIHSPYGLIPVLLAFCCIWFSQPLTTGFLHHHTASRHRATVESCANLLTSVANVVLGLIFGQIATHFSIFRGYQLLGGLLLVYTLVWIFAARGLVWPRPARAGAAVSG